MFPKDEIQETLDKHGYQAVRMIGKGGFAECFLVVSRKYQQPFACKVIKLSTLHSHFKTDTINNEYDALVHSMHPNIIQILNNYAEYGIKITCSYSSRK